MLPIAIRQSGHIFIGHDISKIVVILQVFPSTDFTGWLNLVAACPGFSSQRIPDNVVL